jgi:hypothetical protein
MAGNSRISLVLQERDLRLLESLEVMRVINREQAKVIAGFHSTRRANDRLLTLARLSQTWTSFSHVVGRRSGVGAL